MQMFLTTVCLNCGRQAQLAPGYCLVCGSNFPQQLPALLPNPAQTAVQLKKAA